MGPGKVLQLSTKLSGYRYVSGAGAVLLTEAVEIGTQRVGGKVLFPQAWREEMDVEGRMGIEPLQHIDEVDVGINPLQATRGKEALHDPDIAGAHFGPAEEPVFSADGNRANLPLQVIGIERHVGIREKDSQRGAPIKRIEGGLPKRIRGEEHGVLHCILQPREELGDHGSGMRSSLVEFRVTRQV